METNYPHNPSCLENNVSLIIKEHHSIKKHQIYCLEKLNSRDLHITQLALKVGKPTAQTHFKKNFQNPELRWKNIYNLPRRVMINTNLDIFRYKLILNILCLNKMLYKFEQKVSPLCSFCMEESESRIHLFHSCTKTNFLWTQLQHSIQNALILDPI